jgi:hypothetical protein
LCFRPKIIDHGGRHGNAMQALAQWQHPMASSEAQDVLHRVMQTRISPPHPHGNQNRQQFSCIFCCH